MKVESLDNIKLAAVLSEVIAECQRRALLSETYKRNASAIVNSTQRAAALIEAHRKAAV